MAPTPPTAPAVRTSTQTERDDLGALPWVASGIEAGVLGAATVALFFLGVDWLAGRPLWTPYALGSALFLGVPPDRAAPPQMALVLGYSALHVAVFIGFGVPAAFQVLTRGAAMRSAGAAALVGVVLFAGFEVVFLVLAELFLPGLVGALGSGRVALANGLAAASMASFLSLRARGAPAAG